VNVAVERTLQILGPELAAAETQVVSELAEDLPSVAIEGVRLRQVLINLVQNSVQAMGPGGRVTICTRETRLQGGRGGVEVHVEDTGPGIDPSVRDTLFLPFVTTRERGTGLGLAVSQRLVTAAGGLIQVRSRSGRGTTFVVRLPATRRSDPA
jgi:signal transduction histidine kinase